MPGALAAICPVIVVVSGGHIGGGALVFLLPCAAAGAGRVDCEVRASRAPGRRSDVMTVIGVKVKPNARVSRLDKLEDGTWLAEVKAPPIDGRANVELIGLVAKHFGRRKAQVSVKSGASGRRKLVEIDDVD